MFERFILATDLSAASSAIVDCAAGLRELGTRHCLLLQCLDLQQAASTAFSDRTTPLDEMLTQQKAILDAQGFEVEPRIVPGFAKQEINRIADQEDYELIVVGSHGHSMIAEVLLGGVATAVIHSARKPVLVVRLQQREAGGEMPESGRPPRGSARSPSRSRAGRLPPRSRPSPSELGWGITRLGQRLQPPHRRPPVANLGRSVPQRPDRIERILWSVVTPPIRSR